MNNKKIVSICFLVLMIYVIGGSFYYLHEKTSAEREFSRSSFFSLVEVDIKIEDYLNSYEDVLNEVDTDNLEKTLETNPEIKSVYYGTADKRMHISPSFLFPQWYDPTEELWYTGTLNEYGAYWSEPYLKNGKIILPGSKKIKSGESIKGVVGLDIDISSLISQLNARETFGFVPIVYLPDGTIISHPIKENIGEIIPDSISNNIGAGGGGFVYDSNKTKQVVKYQKTRHGWTILNVTSDKEIHKKSDEILVQIIAIGVLLICIVVIISISNFKYANEKR